MQKEQRDSEISVRLKVSGKNRFFAECTPKMENYTYSLYLYRDGELVERSYYSDNNSTVFWPTEPGEYQVRAVRMDPEQNKYSGESVKVRFEGIYGNIDIDSDAPKKQGVWQSVKNVVREISKNRQRVWRLSFYDYTTQNRDSYLGWVWSILNPLINIGTYWFVFGIGIRGGRPVDGYPFVVWMLCGLIPWFFISAGITRGAGAVYAKANIVLRLRYPRATLPVGSIITCFYEHIMQLVIMLVVFAFFGVFPNLYWLNLLYYEVFMLVFLSALALVTSTLTMLARDFQKFINNIIRLLFYITPILWTIDDMPQIIQSIMSLNPFLYVINGFRDSLLYHVNFWQRPLHIVGFWAVTLLMAIFGCHLQQKYQDQFIDML